MKTSATLFIVAAPSGAGKTSLVGRLLHNDPNLALSVSHTTRPQRVGESHGEHYFFVSPPKFDAMVSADAFLEHAQVFDHAYGTSRAAVKQHLDRGRDVILEIDWQGAQQIREKADPVSLFILPPSLTALAHRLKQRGADADAVIERRMYEAVEQISHFREFDYLVVNDDFDRALSELRSIVAATRLRTDPQLERHKDLLAGLLADSPHAL